MDNLEIIAATGAAQIADHIAGQLGAALAASGGPVAITVPGGSTPFPIFDELLTRDVDFSRLLVWPGDDRVVPSDHPASNTGRIRALFEPAGAEVVTLTIMEQVPPFALSWLGMGADGHIASLFPNTDPRADEERRILRLTPDPLPPEAPFDRISLTIPALLDSDAVMFTLGGSEEKRTLFEAAVRGENDLPIARLLSEARQPVICFA